MANSARTLKDLTINGTLAGGTVALNVEGNISGTGTCTAGTIVLSAGSGNRTIAGVTLNNLTVSGHNGTYTLAGNTAINGVLTLSGATDDHIILSTFNLTLSSTASISGGNVNSHIVTNSTGNLVQSVSAGGSKNFPVAPTATSYDPVTVTPTNATSVGVRASLTMSPALNNATKAAPRIWDVSATGAGSTTLVFTPFATAADVTGSAVYGHYTAGAWAERLATHSAGVWTVTHTSGSFSPFGVGFQTAFNATLLPIELSSFTATKSNHQTALAWTTASESNNDHFSIERSANGVNFEQVLKSIIILL
jgi:hypothetical protein